MSKGSICLSKKLKECGIVIGTETIAVEYKKEGTEWKCRSVFNRERPVWIPRLVLMLRSQEYTGFCEQKNEEFDTDIAHDHIIIWIDIKHDVCEIFIDEKRAINPVGIFAYGMGIGDDYEKLIFIDNKHAWLVEEPNGISSLLDLTARYIMSEKSIQGGIHSGN